MDGWQLEEMRAGRSRARALGLVLVIGVVEVGLIFLAVRCAGFEHLS